MGDMDHKVNLNELLSAVKKNLGMDIPVEIPTTFGGLLALLRTTRAHLDKVIGELESRGTDHCSDTRAGR